MEREYLLRLRKYKEILSRCPYMLHAAKTASGSSREPEILTLCHVFSPALGCFTEWLIKKALINGVRRLYFLSRDGYFFYRAACVYCEKLKIPVECRYLYCSRLSLRVPLYHLYPNKSVEQICALSLYTRFGQILKRAALTDKEIIQISKQLNIPAGTKITLQNLPAIKQKLLNCDSFMQAMKLHSAAAMPYAAGYFKQQGLLENNCAIVDSGWAGSVQQSLCDIIPEAKNRIQGYYWGLYELPKKANPKQYQCYFFSPSKGIKQKVYFNNCLFEAVFSAPHGSVIGYSKAKSGDYIPLLAPVSANHQKQLSRFETYFLNYIEELIKIKPAISCRPKDKAAVQKLFKLMMTYPALSEAKSFGRIDFCDDVISGTEKPIAADLNNRQLRLNHPLPKLLERSGIIRFSDSRSSAWLEGSAALQKAKRHIPHFNLYKYMRYSLMQYRYRAYRRNKNG